MPYISDAWVVLTPCSNIASSDILTKSKLYFRPCLFASELSNAPTSTPGSIGRLIVGTFLYARKWEAHKAPPSRPPPSLPKFPLDRDDRAPAPPPATRKPKLVSANLLHVPCFFVFFFYRDNRNNKTTKRHQTSRNTKTLFTIHIHFFSFNAQALPHTHTACVYDQIREISYHDIRLSSCDPENINRD